MEVVSLNPRRRFIFSLVFLAASIAASCPLRGAECRANERVLDFQGRVECLEDASIKVEERISVLSEGQEIRHGIYRDILLRNWEGRPSRIEILGARLDGNPVALRGEVITQGKRIYLGDPDRELPPGIHLFSLSYRMSGQVANLRDRDEIYWNVTGNDWTFPIERASCLVLPPGGINPGGNLHVAAYTGPRGSRGTDVGHEVSDKGILFTTTRPLEPGEGLTVAVGWPKGLVFFPPSSSRNTGWITFAAGMGLVLLYYLSAWFLSGRDAPKEIVTPLFEPPEKMTPAEARRIYRMALDMGAFPAELVDLAVKGVLRIEERDGDFFLSMDRQPDVSDLPGHQKALVKSLLAAALESSGRLESIKAAAGRRGLIGRLARKSLEMGRSPPSLRPRQAGSIFRSPAPMLPACNHPGPPCARISKRDRLHAASFPGTRASGPLALPVPSWHLPGCSTQTTPRASSRGEDSSWPFGFRSGQSECSCSQRQPSCSGRGWPSPLPFRGVSWPCSFPCSHFPS